MKTIKLLTVKVTSNMDLPKDTELEYKKEFLRLVQVFPEGATIDEMRRYTKLNKKLRDAAPDSTLYLEDAECDLLAARLKSARFNFFSEEVIEMVDAVLQAKETEAPHLMAAEAAAGD